MRTNYKAIENIIKRNFSFDDIRNSPTRGKVVVFTEGTEHVRIVLVEGNDSSYEQGLHIRNLADKSELEGSLVDACNTALKDNFSTIFVHMQPKPSEERRLRRIEGAKAWLRSGKVVEQFALGNSLNKRGLNNEQLVDKVLESMTEDQLDVLMALASASYSQGCTSTRKFFVEARRRKQAETKGA